MKPIIFNSESVRGILEDRKSQTRRIIKPQPEYRKYLSQDALYKKCFGYIGVESSKIFEYCPYKVGDVLWVKECWRCTGGGDLRNIIYKAEGDTAMSFCGVDDGRSAITKVAEPHWAEWDRLVYKTNRSCDWRSSIHMPEWAARIWPEVTEIKIEKFLGKWVYVIELIRQKSTNERDRLRNELIDMQCAITGWQEGLAFNSADDLISALDEMITKTLKDTEAKAGKDGMRNA